ncbi:unnamed protein product [Parnassius mnemosyne]|uniref:Uncharacterized protein n=1 Tax=Parnassius mnemosyne TaxID=213953 RepID=A0AAV1L0R8_9NEOP
MDSCRVCMGKNIDMLHMFDTGDIVDKIYFCTGIQFKNEDGLPSQICNTCLEDLSIAHKFKTQCLLAEETLTRKIKEEKPEDIKQIKEPASCEFSVKSDDNDDVKEDLFEPGDDITEVLEDAKVKDESNAVSVKKNSRVKLKIKTECVKEEVSLKARKKRGPYNKSGVPKRLRKYKFRKLFCEPCGLKFTSKQQSDEHKRDVHKDSDSFVCEICGKVFVHRASHYTHVRSHLPPQYACDHCDYCTWHKHDLVKHVRIHTGVKMYQCEYCTASYYTSSNLTCHIRRYHEKERRYHCELCDRSFYDRTKLNRHLDSHNEIKRFECDVCHACFTRRCYWKKHLQRQHNVIVPPQRPGRQKTNRQIGEPTESLVGKNGVAI